MEKKRRSRPAAGPEKSHKKSLETGRTAPKRAERQTGKAPERSVRYPVEPAVERELPEDVLIGRNAVAEALKSGRGINKLLVASGDREGSIGEILALANGVNNYIKSVEEETLSEYPLQIQSTGFDMTSMMLGAATGAGGNTGEAEGDGDQDKVGVTEMVTNMFSSIGSNDLASLKEYLDSGQSDIDQYTNAIEYSYNATPQIYSSNTENVRQVNPDKSFTSLGLGSTSSSNSSVLALPGPAPGWSSMPLTLARRITASSSASTSGTCRLGMTRVCPTCQGLMSRKAMHTSSS